MKIRLMRGQCVVREIDRGSDTIWTPEEKNQRSVRTHSGRVLGLGAPALTKRGAEVPWGFDVGALVQFHYVHHREAHTRDWPEDGKLAVWIPQVALDAVWDEEITP
jgi:hypothetical protein